MTTGRLAVTVLTLFLLISCSGEPTVEQQIIATINEMKQLAEEGKRRPFMDMVAGDFNGQLGALTKDEFHRFMVFQWNHCQAVDRFGQATLLVKFYTTNSELKYGLR